MKRPAEVLVFIPGPGVGHVVSTVEIAKMLVARDDRLLVAILVINLPSDKPFTNTDPSVSPRISFVNLPETHFDMRGLEPIFFLKVLVENHKTHVRDAIDKLAMAHPSESESESKPRLAGLVVDMFCTTMIDVAHELGVPSYVFFTSNAAVLGVLFHLQKLRDEQSKHVAELVHSGADLVVPSFVNPLPVGVLPNVLLHKESAESFLNDIRRFRETKGILVNTFSELEPHALHSIISDDEIQPVYHLGPLLNLKSSDDKGLGIMEWLDDQPALSVVFLCFGSMGSFGEAQVKEIASGLEHSGHRFLWSLRKPSSGKMGVPSDYVDFKEVLPEGFLDRTVGIGKVIGWAPQAAILAHPAVGGFVSHCGWNSALESVWYGVPLAAWPMYAEQQLTAFELVKELGLAVEVKMDYVKDGGEVVSAQDIERGIRQVMEHDSDTRKKMKEMREKSKKVLMEGGSSYTSLGRFIDQI